jgi:uncharacterized membrane protein YphA (DoxX/SURF4 family)
VYLGVGLFVRGALFVAETSGVGELVDLSQFDFASAALIHYITFSHLIGGLLLAVGFFTRIAAAVQIPILMGAVFVVHLEEGLLSANQSLEFSTLVLFLLAVVFVFGPGRWSADHYVFERETPEEEDFEAWWREDDERVLQTGDGYDDVEPTAPGEEAGAPSGKSDSGEPVTGASSGGVAVAGSTTAPVRTVGDLSVKECACGNDISHPRVIIQPKYGWTSGFYFMLGISAPVKEIVFYCQDCSTIMKRSTDPELLERYRWHTS